MDTSIDKAVDSTDLEDILIAMGEFIESQKTAEDDVDLDMLETDLDLLVDNIDYVAASNEIQGWQEPLAQMKELVDGLEHFDEIRAEIFKALAESMKECVVKIREQSDHRQNQLETLRDFLVAAEKKVAAIMDNNIQKIRE